MFQMRTRSRLCALVTVALILGSLLLVLLAEGCSTPSTSPAGSGTSDTLTATKPYGSLTIATNVGSGLVDPLLSSPIGYSSVGAAVFDSLWHRSLYFNDQTPGLAERWEISPDGLTHTFYIRKGIKFHDGSDLTASDVKFSIERLMGPKDILLSDAVTWRSSVAAVDLIDSYTVALRLKKPQFELLVNAHGSMTPVMPKKYIEEKGEEYFGKYPVGSGPWKVVKFEPGVRLELEALDSHWRAAPRFRNITILSVSEESTKVAMLKTGELDMASVSADSVPGLEASGLRMQSFGSGGGYWGFPLFDRDNPKEYAFGDVRVRKSLQLAINAKELADKLFRGRAEPVSVASLYAESPAKINAYDSSLLKPYPFDPEGAKKLLAEAGYPGGFNTRLIDVGGGDMRSLLCLALAGYLGKTGINATVVPFDFGVFNNNYKARSPETFNSVYLLSMAGTGVWDRMITVHHSTKSSPKNVNNPRLDWLLDNIPGTRDPVERERFVFEAMGLAKNEFNVTAILGTHSILALGNKVGEVAPALYAYEISGLMYETITHAK